jgi:hypothetical protein
MRRFSPSHLSLGNLFCNSHVGCVHIGENFCSENSIKLIALTHCCVILYVVDTFSIKWASNCKKCSRGELNDQSRVKLIKSTASECWVILNCQETAKNHLSRANFNLKLSSVWNKWRFLISMWKVVRISVPVALWGD